MTRDSGCYKIPGLFLGRHKHELARRNHGDCISDLLDVWLDVAETRALGAQKDNAEGGATEVLLMGNVLVAGDEHVEGLLGQAEQRSVLHAGPTRPKHRPNVELRQWRAEFVGKILVQQDAPHATRSSRAFVACSMNAFACSRRTEGKSSRNSSTVDPPTRWSMRICTGTRVPTKTGVPPMISGSLWTTRPSGRAVGRISGMVRPSCLSRFRQLPDLPVALPQLGDGLVPRDCSGRMSLVLSNTTRNLALLRVSERQRLRVLRNVDGLHDVKSMCFSSRVNPCATPRLRPVHPH